ncbi:NAD(P)H-dependent glycerol-3-phosphate dehydrogenase [Butyrivibrio sp. NC3005]|uniref:NAD(P)H-dependent glycerol-3-phosphate dehydrogenase n=1 Tax=Butyrivibrio sp. NC3005 TaxID=1280685 RepID=UPI0004037709|nr:NAD(P)H-dependent glycerol-3-phosphate dehydrogenase [Butyrivibrio sp. NC3005]
MSKEKVGIIGAGSWGMALAYLMSNNGHDVTVWSRTKENVEILSREHENKEKLPGVILPDDVKFTFDLIEAIKDKKIIVLVVPSAHVRKTVEQMKPYLKDDQIIVNCAKGIEESSLLVMSQVIRDVLGNDFPKKNIAVLSGPSHAEEVGKGLPTLIVIGAFSESVARFLQNAFMNKTFRVYISPDMKGIEIGAALKNVIALASGIADGLGYGDNTKAAIITRGIAEITRLGLAAGGQPETFSGLTGMGDLIVTCASMHSRNRRAGILIGQGKSLEETQKEVHMVVEGAFSAKAALKLAKVYDVEMPIVEQVCEVLFYGKKASEAVEELMLRDKKIESHLLKFQE